MKLKNIIRKTTGVSVEEAPSEEEEMRRQRHEKIVLAWKWLRGAIDRGLTEAFETGDTARITALIDEPSLGLVLQQVDMLKNAGLVWLPPSGREQLSKVEVLEEDLDAKGALTSFTVKEVFPDRCRLRNIGTGAESAADGAQRGIVVQVNCYGQQDYRIKEIRQVAL